jgi:hypothetical protein
MMNRRQHRPVDAATYPLPQPVAPPVSPGAFVMICPVVCNTGVNVEQL